MIIPIVAHCENCDRTYRATADLSEESKGGNAWHWTRCSCGELNLGVVHGEWERHRPWHRSQGELWANRERDSVVTFERGDGR